MQCAKKHYLWCRNLNTTLRVSLKIASMQPRTCPPTQSKPSIPTISSIGWIPFLSGKLSFFTYWKKHRTKKIKWVSSKPLFQTTTVHTIAFCGITIFIIKSLPLLMTTMSFFDVFLNLTSNSLLAGLSLVNGLVGALDTWCSSIFASSNCLLFKVNVTGLVASFKALIVPL